jgi:hypothetical protein
MNQKEAQELILKDVISFYNSRNRSVTTNAHDNNQCMYNGPDGKHCAAARWMTDPSKAIEHRSVKHMMNLLKPEAQLAGGFFMATIQDLHDCESNWDSKGLSDHGKIMVAEISRAFRISNPLES